MREGREESEGREGRWKRVRIRGRRVRMRGEGEDEEGGGRKGNKAEGRGFSIGVNVCFLLLLWARRV